MTDPDGDVYSAVQPLDARTTGRTVAFTCPGCGDALQIRESDDPGGMAEAVDYMSHVSSCFADEVRSERERDGIAGVFLADGVTGMAAVESIAAQWMSRR